MRNGTAAKLLTPDAPGSLLLGWAQLGASKYEDMWGTARGVDLPAWTDAGALGDLYDASKDKITSGPLLSAVRALPDTGKSLALSRINGLLAAREEMAYTYYGEQAACIGCTVSSCSHMLWTGW